MSTFISIAPNKYPHLSHAHERKDKTCLNCGAHLIGRYCQDCGQENLEPRESIWHFIVHFFNDVIHFEGKFFTTMGLLLRRPGFVAQEHMAGRRMRYINPIRLYLFMSFAFFLIAAMLPTEAGRGGLNLSYTGSPQERRENDSISNALLQGKAVTLPITDAMGNEKDSIVTLDTSIGKYDSLQSALPASERDGAFARFANRRSMAMQAYRMKHPDTADDDMRAIVRKSAPTVFIISLPLFAFGLYLLYIRKRRTYYFVSHGVFAIHFYCVFFIAMLLYYMVALAGDTASIIAGIMVFVLLCLYLYKAMRRFYRQRRGKTILKFILMLGYIAIFATILFVGALFNTLLHFGGH